MKTRLEEQTFEEIPECVFISSVMSDLSKAVKEGIDSHPDLLPEEKPFLIQLIYKRGINLDGRYDRIKHVAEKVNGLSLVEV